VTHHERGLEGQVGVGGNTSNGPPGGSPGGSTAEPTPSAQLHAYWLEHRQGPFLYHKVDGPCEAPNRPNVGYLSDVDRIVEQGFIPCPKCIGGN
jgi:hypothetical protein